MPEPAVARLAATDLLRALDPDELAQVAQLVRVRNVRRGDSVVTHQDESRDVYFVLVGEVTVEVVSEDGRPIIFRELRTGESFGELAAIDGAPRSADVVARVDSTVAHISAQNFLNVVTRYPPVALAVMRRLTALVRSLSERVGEGVLPVPVRICRELSRLCATRRIGNGASLKPPPRHADIASRVNTHREAVSRLFSELAREGLLRKGEGEIVVPDLRALDDYASRLADG